MPNFVFYCKNIRKVGNYLKIVSFGNVWEEATISVNKRKHPHQKPRELIKALIEATTSEKDLIVDPCAGSFMVLEICQELNRRLFRCWFNF